MNWLYVGLVAVAGTAALLFMGGAVTWQVYRQGSSGLPITGGWSWPLVWAVNLGCVAGIAALYRKIYCDAHTNISPEGLSQPAQFGGIRSIAWKDVTNVEVFGGVGYHVFSGKRKIVVTPYAYARPTEVIELLRVNIERGRGAT
jgi:hypothetical protein